MTPATKALLRSSPGGLFISGFRYSYALHTLRPNCSGNALLLMPHHFRHFGHHLFQLPILRIEEDWPLNRQVFCYCFVHIASLPRMKPRTSPIVVICPNPARSCIVLSPSLSSQVPGKYRCSIPCRPNHNSNSRRSQPSGNSDRISRSSFDTIQPRCE